MSADDSSPFSSRLIIALVVAAVIALGGFALLSTYARDLSAGRDGGPHALSRSGVGFAGLVRLIEATGATATLVESREGWDTEDLLVVAMMPGQDQGALADLLERRRALPTLLVLPKWDTVPSRTRPGWVERIGPMSPDVAEWMVEEVAPLEGLTMGHETGDARARLLPDGLPDELARPAPVPVQTASAPEATVLLATPSKAAVLMQLGEGPLYVLADPDLLANHALDDRAAARAALLLLSELNSTEAEGVAFDLVVAGLAGGPNPFKLAFEPPFVALTLALLGAALLAAVQGAIRFGRPVPVSRAIPFGSRALVENAAALLRRAGRDHRAGVGYAQMVRDRAAQLVAAPADLGGAALEAHLDRVAGTPGFTTIAGALGRAANRDELLAAAIDADRWLHDLKARAGGGRGSRNGT